MKTGIHNQTGFTLIELMMVITIIGILAAVALPAYHSYAIRAKLLDTLQFSGAAKTFIWEEYFTRGQMPFASTDTANAVQNMMMTSKYTSNAVYTRTDENHSSIEVTFHNMGVGVDNSTMIFKFETDGNQITLDCKGGSLPDTFRPASCRSNS